MSDLPFIPNEQGKVEGLKNGEQTRVMFYGKAVFIHVKSEREQSGFEDIGLRLKPQDRDAIFVAYPDQVLNACASNAQAKDK